MDIILALITGIISAFIYSLIQGAYSYFRWANTLRFFLSQIRDEMRLIDYNILVILDINPIYSTEYEKDHLMTDEEFFEEIASMDIRKEQYVRLYKMIKETKMRMETLRKEALALPIFTSKDFHTIDKYIFDLGNYLSSYCLLSEEIIEPKIQEKIKSKLIGVIKKSKADPFATTLIRRIEKYIRIKINRYKFEGRIKSSKDEAIPF